VILLVTLPSGAGVAQRHGVVGRHGIGGPVVPTHQQVVHSQVVSETAQRVLVAVPSFVVQ
jgi:hypothetical protein